MKKLTIIGLSLTLILGGASSVMASEIKNNEVVVKLQTNAEIVYGYNSINTEERGILLNAYDELDILQGKINKIYGEDTEITSTQEAEVEKLVVQWKPTMLK